MTTIAHLHGFLGSCESFEDVVGALPGDRTVTGLGISGHRPAGGDGDASGSIPSMEAEAARLAEQIQKAEAPVHLLGYSLGARLLLLALAEHPHLWRSGHVRWATLLGVSPGLESDGERRERLASDERWAERFESESVGSVLDDWFAQPVFEGIEKRADAPRLARERARREALDGAGLAAALRAFSLGRMPNLWPQLSALELPVTLVVGALDEKFSAIAERMATELTQCAVRRIAGAGHNLLLEAPDELARLLSAPRPTDLVTLDSTALRIDEMHAEIERRRKG